VLLNSPPLGFDWWKLICTLASIFYKMKKLFLPYLLFFIPIFTLAQGESPLFKDVYKKVIGIASSFKFNDQLGIMQVKLNDTSFELIALDNHLEILWRASFKGYGVACGRFKNNILAISDSGYSLKKGYINPYYAFLVDPASGKVILQKKIFEQKVSHHEEADAHFTSDGTGFNLIVRDADINFGFLSSYKNKTEDVTLIGLDGKLDVTYLKPKIPDEPFISMAVNDSGDFFLLTTRENNSVQARRYEYGSIDPSEAITLSSNHMDKTTLLRAGQAIIPSEEDRNVLFLSIADYDQNDDREILTGKFNFATHQAQAVREAFTGKHIREIEKSYVPPTDDSPKPNIGGQKKQLRVLYAKEHNGKLITVSGESFFVSVNNGTTFFGKALIINCYSSELKPLFQQLMPVDYSYGEQLNSAFALGQSDFKVIGNTNMLSIYGQLDLSTGKWLKLLPLAQKQNETDEYVIWFNNNFIVPYVHSRVFGRTYNIDLALNSY
jgi:hypothetical protein